MRSLEGRRRRRERGGVVAAAVAVAGRVVRIVEVDSATLANVPVPAARVVVAAA